MPNQPPPAAPAPWQARLLARLVAAIYGITETLIPIVQAIATTPGRPWQQRTRLQARFWTIIRAFIALPLRIQPGTLSANPVFAPPRPKTRTNPAQAPAAPKPTTPPRPRSPGMTPRQLAQRLAFLLLQLERLAMEAGTTLTAAYHHHAARARTIAGCHALPSQSLSPQTTWERSG